MPQSLLQRLADAAPDLERILNGKLETASPPPFEGSQIRRETVRVTMRDGIRLATELFLPPVLPAPGVAIRTPYGRANENLTNAILAFARRGYVVISQDCRGTGDSEPDVWDFGLHEREDGVDFVDWVIGQKWFNGFLSSFGGSYAATTQWCMSTHSAMSAIAPEVSGVGVIRGTVRKYMFVNGYSRTVGKGAGRLPVSYAEIERLIEPETMAGGYFNEPLRTPLSRTLIEQYPNLSTMPLSEAKRWVWAHYCTLSDRSRVELIKQILGVTEFSYVDRWTLPAFFDCLITYAMYSSPAVDPADACQRYHAPALFISGWYDWNLNDVLPSWELFQRKGRPEVASRSRLLITPAAHHAPGYHEGEADHPELRTNHRSNIDLLHRWYEAVRQGATDAWPKVIYYLMGANEWRFATDWPIPEARQTALYLGSDGTLSFSAPHEPSDPDLYTYDPTRPTPTVGGSILSFLYPVGSVDVSEVQKRADVLTYVTAPLEPDLDVVGPLRLILYASSSAIDTDFVARLSDLFPDGRAIQLQSGILRVRYRDVTGDPELVEPGRIYRFEIDLWATANRFKAGHRMCLDISSADFPKFDRNSNRGGQPGDPILAHQTIYHDPDHPSHLLLSVIGNSA